jgi:adenine-specific DNA-methyltransferase
LPSTSTGRNGKFRATPTRLGESFFVRHAYFLGANDPYKALKTTLKAEIDPDAWATLNSDTSRPFEKPKNGRIAVKVINHLGDEVMKVFRI